MTAYTVWVSGNGWFTVSADSDEEAAEAADLESRVPK